MRELSSKGALLQQQVWTDYIARMVLWKGDKTHYPLEQTRRWLTWLAQQMRVHQQTIFYAEYLQPDWLTNNQQRIVMWLTVRVPALVLGALASILIFILIPESVPPVFLLQIGLIGGFVGDCLSRNANTETTVAESHLSLSKRVHMMSCILLSILIAASFGLYPDSHYKMVNWVHNGSILGFGSGLSAWAFQMLLFRTHSQHTSVLCTYPSLRRHRFAWFNTIVPQRIWQAAIVLGAGIGLSEGLSYGNSNFSYELSVKISTGLSTGLGVGLTIVLVSVILNTSLRQLRFAERIHWTPQNLSQPKHLRTNLIVIGMVFLFCGLGFGLSEGLCFGLDVGLSHGLGYGLSYGFSYGLLLGLYQSMVQEHIEDQDRHQFNQGIRRSLYNGVLVSLVSAPIIVSMQVLSEVLSAALGYWLSYGPNAKLSTGLGIGWIYWLYYGHDFVWHMAIGGFFLMWAMSGGLTILRHYVIRWLLACSHRFPWRAQTFLDDVTARILLQRVGGGYRFMHRLLLDYFANLETTPSSAISPTTPLIQQIPPP